MNKIDEVQEYDFTEVNKYDIDMAIELSVKRAREHVIDLGYQEVCDYPCVPEIGCTDVEIETLNTCVDNLLPDDYKAFLRKYRYLKISDGFEIGGLDHAGVCVTEKPWLSDVHDKEKKYIVFANYWRYADGDQLLIDVSKPNGDIIAYLHDSYNRFQYFAPSFKCALWRLVYE